MSLALGGWRQEHQKLKKVNLGYIKKFGAILGYMRPYQNNRNNKTKHREANYHYDVIRKLSLLHLSERQTFTCRFLKGRLEKKQL